MRRVQVLHQDEGHAALGGQRVHQPAARIQAARRGADADDKKIIEATWVVGSLRRACRLHGFAYWDEWVPVSRLKSGNSIVSLSSA
jgi:hypothetical protein